MTNDDLLRSHDDLRAALILAGKEIRKLNFGRHDNPVLEKLRQVLREARAVAKTARGSHIEPFRGGRAHPEHKSLIDQVKDRKSPQ